MQFAHKHLVLPISPFRLRRSGIHPDRDAAWHHASRHHLAAATRGAIGSLSAASIGKDVGRHRHHECRHGTSGRAPVPLPCEWVNRPLTPWRTTPTSSSPAQATCWSCTQYRPDGGIDDPVSNTNSSEPPLVPHVTAVLEGINYTVDTYPTTSTSTPGLVTVVVIVTWKSPTVARTRSSAKTDRTP